MKTLIKAPLGLFFCEGHLEDLPVSRQSQDPRYCQECCRFLEQEVLMLGPKSWLPSWGPRHSQKPSNQNLGEKNLHPHPTRGVVAKKPKQLDFFATTNFPPLPAPTTGKGLEPLPVVLAKSSRITTNLTGYGSLGEYEEDETNFGS